MNAKPTLHGPVDGNIFSIVGACRRVLKKAGQSEKVNELSERVTAAKNYAEALSICEEYVEFSV